VKIEREKRAAEEEAERQREEVKRQNRLREEAEERERQERQRRMNESTYSYGGGYTSFNDGGSFYSGFGGNSGGSSYQPQPKVSTTSYSQTSSFSGPTTKSGAPDMRYSANRAAAGLGTTKMNGAPDMRFACNRKK
jgi:hypothetical protein